MKDLAKHFTRAQLKVQRPAKSEAPTDEKRKKRRPLFTREELEKGASPTPHTNDMPSPNDVTAVPDSWEARWRPTQDREEQKSSKGPETKKEEEQKGPEMEVRARTRKRQMRADKVRRLSLSISVSAEEEDLLMAHADKLQVPFSRWARETLFRAMGRSIPSRRG